MFYMERGCSPSLRRPRTQTTRKPRLGRYLFLELEKANGFELHTSLEKNVPRTPAPSKKGVFLHEIAGPRKKVLVHASSHGYTSQKGISKAEEGTENQLFKASNRKDRQRGLHDAQPDCASHGSSESDIDGLPFSNHSVAGSKHPIAVNSKDLNYLAGKSHVDKVICKPGLLNQTQSHRRRVVPKKFCDDDTDKGGCLGQNDNSRGQNTARNVCVKYNRELVRKAEIGFPSHRKSSTKNKMLKKGSPFKADEYLSDEGAHLMQNMEKWSTARESTCVSEARRRLHNVYAQEYTPDRDNDQVYGEEESSEEDAVSGSNYQSTLDLEQSMHPNGKQGASNLSNRGELQLPTVRKSSRIPKKRIFNDDDEAPLRRQKKKLAVERADQEESTDGMANEQLANECSERKSTDIVGDDHDNDMDESFLDEKKELPLTARQRALRITKEGGDSEVSISVGFPNGLQPAVLPKRQKENLTEAEQAIKKEEAAKRRKQQMEKNAKEIQAVAIQKILGQESSRKKREEKLQKQRQEIEQEKQAAAMVPPVKSIRWVMGPSGNVVSFSQDLELPKIFSGPCSYPQEREKCAGPSCNNVYKYRDSKTRLPLCSLQCYRAVQELPSTGSAF